jgi:hypothetical protein
MRNQVSVEGGRLGLLVVRSSREDLPHLPRGLALVEPAAPKSRVAVPITQRVAVVIARSLRRLIALLGARRLRPLPLRQSGGTITIARMATATSVFITYALLLGPRAPVRETRRSSSASDLTRCSRSRMACPETDWVGKSHRGPGTAV